MKGCDYSFARPAPATLKAAGFGFVIRYLTGTGKALSPAELAELHRAGLGVGLAFESGAKRALEGKGAGVQDALSASAAAMRLGLGSAAIYFTVDDDITRPLEPAVAAYFAGIGTVLGRARVGVYGDTEAFDAAGPHASRYWQTNATAWSHGKRDARAHIVQGPSRMLGRASIDTDELVKNGGGIVFPPAKPPPKPAPAPPPRPASAPLTGVPRFSRARILRWWNPLGRIFRRRP